MRMRQSLNDLESAFVESIDEDREARDALAKRAIVRTHRRELASVNKRGRRRFWTVFLVLLGTAVLVTWGMFQALYIVMS